VTGRILVEQNTTTVGTIRPNMRNFLADLVTAALDRGDSKFALVSASHDFELGAILCAL